MPLPNLDTTSWRQLARTDASRAARQLLTLVRERLSSAQQKACIAWLADEEMLAAAFAKAAALNSPLSGVPCFLKDLFPLAGAATGAGSSFLAQERGPDKEDGALAHQLKSLGLVCAGKSQMHEFAYGVTGENLFYGHCDNPARPGFTSGGSSSGSAALVAAGVVPLAFGSDTGGSIRVPAAFCGLWGLRHLVRSSWIRDAIPLAPSCDSAGWFTRTAEELRQATEVLSPGSKKNMGRSPRGCHLRFGTLDADIRDSFDEAASAFCGEADEATEAQLLHAFKDCAQTYSVLTSIEAAEFHEPWLDSRKNAYSEAVWSRIDRGRHWSEEEQAKALLCREGLRSTLASYFLTYDFLVLPSVPVAGIRQEDCTRFDRMRILELNAPASLGGLPVLAVPIRARGGPQGGLQILMPSPDSAVLNWVLETAESPV